MPGARKTLSLARSLPRPARLIGTALLSLTALVAGAAVPVAGASGLPGRAGATIGPRTLVATNGPAAGTDVQLTSRTIVVPPALVKSSLSSVSGSTFTFSNTSGALGQVAPGKVLLLEGEDAVVVQGVHHVGSKLVLSTAPATITDLVQSGSLQVSSPPDSSSGIGAPDPGGAANLVAPGKAAHTGAVATLGDGLALSTMAAVRNGPVSYSGKSGKFTYSLNLHRIPEGVAATGNVCYVQTGDSCGSGLSIDVTLSGTFTWGSEDLVVGVNGGLIDKGSFAIKDMLADMDVSYAVVRGDVPNVGAKPPALKIPFSFDIPLCGTPLGCAGIPLMSKFSTAIYLRLGVASRNSSVTGGVHVTISGSPMVSGFTLGSVGGSVSTPHVKGSFNLGSAVTPASAGIVVAMQAKFGVGLGVSFLSGLYYVSAIASVGETTGSLVAGMSCVAFDGDFSITGNFELQLFKFVKASPAKTFYDKPASYKQPGC